MNKFCIPQLSCRCSHRIASHSKRPIYLNFCKVLNWKKILLPLLKPLTHTHSLGAHFRLILFLQLFLSYVHSQSNLYSSLFLSLLFSSCTFLFIQRVHRDFFFTFNRSIAKQTELLKKLFLQVLLNSNPRSLCNNSAISTTSQSAAVSK